VACPLCDGSGWKEHVVDGVARVSRCDCLKEALGDRLLSEARIPKRYQHCSFENFLAYNEHLEKALRMGRQVAEAFPVVERGLFLEGLPGVGKTHLAVAVLAQVIRTRGAVGLFYDTRDLLRLIRSTYDPVNQTAEMDVLRPVMRADLLVLDDLGAEKTSEWVEETLNLIVNARYSEKRTTIFTSNYKDIPDSTDPDSLLFRVGFRMRSRLHEMCEFLVLDGGDYRFMPKNGGVDDLVMLWKERQRATKRPGMPGKATSQARARLDPGTRTELGWSGGRAGSS
jgi:DNA replication protein DnaC